MSEASTAARGSAYSAACADGRSGGRKRGELLLGLLGATVGTNRGGLLLAQDQFLKRLFAFLASVFEDWHRELSPALFVVGSVIPVRPDRRLNRSSKA